MTNSIVATHLKMKLIETADRLRDEQTLTTSEISEAFLAVACRIRDDQGRVTVAEWLRDAADRIERRDPRLTVLGK